MFIAVGQKRRVFSPAMAIFIPDRITHEHWLAKIVQV
jgi:hypothetical protein